MQQVLFQLTDSSGMESWVGRETPGHGTGTQQDAANDDSYESGNSTVRLAFSVVGNVIGGALLLSALVLLPHIVADLLG